MALRLEDKKALVAEVNEVAATAESAIAAEYRGLSVAQMTEFRAKARNEGVYVRVVKNTLAKRAVLYQVAKRLSQPVERLAADEMFLK